MINLALLSQDGEAELLERIQTLAPQYRTRPSALQPLLRATGSALGALSAVLPRPYSEAIKGGLHANSLALNPLFLHILLIARPASVRIWWA